MLALLLGVQRRRACQHGAQVTGPAIDGHITPATKVDTQENFCNGRSCDRTRSEDGAATHAAVAHAQMAPTAARISEIQAALASEGAYQGEPNGKWDDATVDAMRQFQASHGLNPTGKIDALTLEKLGLGSEVAGWARRCRRRKRRPPGTAADQQP